MIIKFKKLEQTLFENVYYSESLYFHQTKGTYDSIHHITSYREYVAKSNSLLVATFLNFYT
jgi:hypothetical protein